MMLHLPQISDYDLFFTPRSARSSIRIAMVIRVQHFKQISAALKKKTHQEVLIGAYS